MKIFNKKKKEKIPDVFLYGKIKLDGHTYKITSVSISSSGGWGECKETIGLSGERV